MSGDCHSVICIICGEEIGIFHPGQVSAPVQSGMFHGKTPEHAPPFMTGADWEFLSCPVCKLRAVPSPTEILTKTGIYNAETGKISMDVSIPAFAENIERFTRMHTTGRMPDKAEIDELPGEKPVAGYSYARLARKKKAELVRICEDMGIMPTSGRATKNILIHRIMRGAAKGAGE